MCQAAFVVMQMEWTASVITFKPSARKKDERRWGLGGGTEHSSKQNKEGPLIILRIALAVCSITLTSDQPD